MYSREEAKRIRESFWTAFGQYMRLVPFADEEKQSWINYKTGVKGLYFRMDTSQKQAKISIEMDHGDEGIRQLMFEQFQQLKGVLEDELDEEWIWDGSHLNQYGKQCCSIYTRIEGVSIFKQEDRPALISFFKPRMIALDQFWSLAKYSFDIFK